MKLLFSILSLCTVFHTIITNQPNPIITSCPANPTIQTALESLAAAINTGGAALCTALATGASSPISGQLNTLILPISTVINIVVNDCGQITTDIAGECATLIADLNCILAFVQSLNCTCTCPISPCINVIVKLIDDQVIAAIQAAITKLQTVPTPNPVASACIANLTALIKSFNDTTNNCTGPTTPPATCNTSSSPGQVNNLAQCANLGSVGTTVTTLLNQLQTILALLLGILCPLLNKLIGQCGPLSGVVSGLLTTLTGLVGNLNTTLTPGTGTGNCTDLTDLTTNCNALIGLLSCLVSVILLLATSSGQNPCICGVLNPLLTQVLAIVNQLLGQLLGVAGGNLAGSNCYVTLLTIKAQLESTVKCCPNNTCNILPPLDAPKSGTASLTTFTSYPDPNSEECIKYNGCKYIGQFAFVDGKQPESWVKTHNIIAIHQNVAKIYKLKTFNITQGNHQILAKVYDECADSDCDGCCTANAKPSGFLIDMEKYTMQRFGSSDGQVHWVCIDC